MKHLKAYENNNAKFKIPDYKEGDKVVCVDNRDYEHVFDLGKVYTVEELDLNRRNTGKTFCKIVGFDQFVYCYRFISEIEHTMNKYNL